MTGNAATVIVGLSCDYHDAAAAVLVDGELLSAAEQERYSRRKHDASLPVDALADCLRLAGVSARDVDHIVFYEKPLPALARLFRRLGARDVPPVQFAEARRLAATPLGPSWLRRSSMQRSSRSMGSASG